MPAEVPDRPPAGVPRCAVLGDPIAHSLSPTLHRAGYAAVGLDWRYDAVRVPAGGLTAFLDGIAEDPSWRGLSLTMPLKREVLDLVPHRDPRVELAGGANTVVLARDGRPTRLDNTDLPGAVAAVAERHDAPLTAATILGAGATAASTGLAAVERGARRLRLLARDAERAAPTAAVLRAHPAAPVVEVLGLDARPVGELLISTVPAGAQDDALVARCAQVPVVFEVVYHPWPTPLAAAAIADGRALVSGLDLLVHQAALQFTLFTGVPAPLAAMRAAGEAVLAARTEG